MISRRRFLLRAGGIAALGAVGSSAYAVGVEPSLLDVTTYKFTPARWPVGQKLRICVIADIHACEPWMSAKHIRDMALMANELKPDITLLLGDYYAGHDYISRAVPAPEWGEALSVLKAPLGVYAILGNHDLWHGLQPSLPSDDGQAAISALKAAGIKLLFNDAVRLAKDNKPFWLLGLGDQLAMRLGRGRFRGLDDLSGTLAMVKDNAPVILMAHEPFIFSRVPERVDLTLCGHTHGGQINLPIIGAGLDYGRKFKHVYGYINENNREMIISGGLGTSFLPIRVGRPPEILDIHLG